MRSNGHWKTMLRSTAIFASAWLYLYAFMLKNQYDSNFILISKRSIEFDRYFSIESTNDHYFPIYLYEQDLNNLLFFMGCLFPCAWVQGNWIIPDHMFPVVEGTSCFLYRPECHYTFILAPLDKFVIQDTDSTFLGVQFVYIPGFDLLGRQEIINVIAHIRHIEDNIF